MSLSLFSQSALAEPELMASNNSTDCEGYTEQNQMRWQMKRERSDWLDQQEQFAQP